MSNALLNIGKGALTAAQASLATVSHNIANVNTAGYSRQQAQLATAGSQYTGAGFFGRGVDITTVRRQYDQFLTAAVQSSGSASAADAARAQALGAMDRLFGDGELGIGASLDAFFAAAGDLANRPADLATRQVFVARADQLAQRITTIGRQVAALRSEADARLAPEAAQVNNRIDEIARLNNQIVLAQGSGHVPNDLLDQRDAAVQALGAFLTVQAVKQDDGSLNLFTVEGASLLVGQQRAKLEAVRDPDDATRHGLRLTQGSVSQWLDADAVGGGSLAGTLRFRDEDAPAVLNQVGRIAQVLASAVNAQQALGVDMDGNPGAALFKVPDAQVWAASSNSGGGTFTAGIADPGALQASSYEVRWDGAAYQVTRLSDGLVRSSPGLPATFDGLEFDGGGTPAAGDRWRVEPFAAAATGLAASPLSARQVATAYAASVEADAANRGGVRASGFEIVRADAANALPVTITFNDPPDSVTVSNVNGLPPFTVPYAPGQRMPAAPLDYNGWSLTLEGAPVAGDSFTIGPNKAAAADNRNAQALAALAREGLAGGASLNESYAALLGEVGSRTQAMQAAADVSARLHEETTARQQAVAGVNLDEEAADLLRYQQAYQASARIIQASQSLFESLLSAVR